MSDPPDYTQLAKRYLDLWQEQVAASAADPKLMQEMLRFGRLFGQSTPGGEASGEHKDADDRFGPESRAAPSHLSSAGGGGDLAKLARRVADLEERLAALERRAEPVRKPRRKREG